MATRKPWTTMINRVKNNMKPKTSTAPATWKIVKGDKVAMMVGPQKGNLGQVLKVIRPTGQVLVEGIRMVSRKVPPSEENPNGGVYKFETPVHVSDVSLLDPSDNAPCKVKVMRNDAGQKVRISRRTGTEVPKPAYVRVGLEVRTAYDEQTWDTTAEDTSKVTYTVSPLTFEEEITHSMQSQSQSQ